MRDLKRFPLRRILLVERQIEGVRIVCVQGDRARVVSSEPLREMDEAGESFVLIGKKRKEMMPKKRNLYVDELKNSFPKEGDSLEPGGGKCPSTDRLDSSAHSAVNGRDGASSRLFNQFAERAVNGGKTVIGGEIGLAAQRVIDRAYQFAGV